MEAILSQSLRPDEIIVVDDGSTDNSVEIIEKYVNRDPIVRLLRNDKNMGVVFTTNRGIKNACGDYIFLNAADDKAFPGLFEKSMNLLARYPQAGLCYADFIVLDESKGGNHPWEVKLNYSKEPRYFSPAELLALRDLPPLCGTAMIMKKSALDEAGGFQPSLGWWCDWFLDAVVAFRHGLCYLPEPLAALRITGDGGSRILLKDISLVRSNVQETIRLLNSDAYRDVYPSFQKTGILSVGGWDAVTVLCSRRSFWGFLTFRLLRKVFWENMRAALGPRAPLTVKKLYRRLRDKRYLAPA